MWRLIKVAAVLPPVSLCHGLPDPTSPSRVALFLLRTIMPALALLSAAGLSNPNLNPIPNPNQNPNPNPNPNQAPRACVAGDTPRRGGACTWWWPA